MQSFTLGCRSSGKSRRLYGSTGRTNVLDGTLRIELDETGAFLLVMDRTGECDSPLLGIVIFDSFGGGRPSIGSIETEEECDRRLPFRCNFLEAACRGRRGAAGSRFEALGLGASPLVGSLRREASGISRSHPEFETEGVSNVGSVASLISESGREPMREQAVAGRGIVPAAE
jgi:hypothetical protein